jgi:hypothetical protein
MVNDTAFVGVPLLSERGSIPYATYGVITRGVLLRGR